MEMLFYRSTAAAGVGLDDVRNIIEASRRNNARFGISGMLVSAQGRFAQILEGPVENVETLMERIEADPRHGRITDMIRRPALGRSFPTWTMGSYAVAWDQSDARPDQATLDPAIEEKVFGQSLETAIAHMSYMYDVKAAETLDLRQRPTAGGIAHWMAPEAPC